MSITKPRHESSEFWEIFEPSMFGWKPIDKVLHE